MSTMRGGGMGLSAGAERSPRAGSSRARAAELPKRKPNLKALWPEIKALIAPRKGLLDRGDGFDGRQPRCRISASLYFQNLAG